MDWHVIQILFWLVAGLVSFYFSVGNARVWTSIAVGFFLILIAEIIPTAIPLLPGAEIPQVEAMSYIVGTISILVMSHGFQEYYVFSRTLELEGNKLYVYLATVGVIAASLVFILINPEPTERTLNIIRVVENTNWVFLALINIDLIRKIYLNVKDSPISKGFLAFIGVFVFIFLWKGSELYIQVYDLNLPEVAAQFPIRYQISQVVSEVGNLLAGLSVGGTFLFLARLLR
ncbi:hypothetical protein DESUT3_15710 [Desulfuromonas versatilis]|uniref:Uncharacterized protein n=1 Tax=Desulfuromonas versatilis TaxID=2802975 RepID=A0ABM8HUZ0_9BACT|nr:hypothetical protein [Desulfuromonas versatilis]BCR04502.1 hypothetical protein DESUT3_15710 [Desulfuromonas versatilis]